MSIADRVRVLCALAGTPISRISELAGLSRGALAHIGSGRVDDPGLRTLQAIAEVTGVSLDWLGRGIGDLPDAGEVQAAVARATERSSHRVTP